MVRALFRAAGSAALLTVSVVAAPQQALAGLAPIGRTLAVQRACQMGIWGMPVVGLYDIELSTARDLGSKPGDIEKTS